MKKIEFGQAVTVLTNIAVIAGIAFLAIEIRQNTNAQLATSRQTLLASDLGLLKSNNRMEVQMSQALVQINVKFSNPTRNSDEDPSDVARVIAGQPGLIWKIWLRNAETGEGGGWYLFDSRAHAEDYLNGELVTKFRANPAFSEVSIKTFDIAEGATQITRGPIGGELSNVA